MNSMHELMQRETRRYFFGKMASGMGAAKNSSSIARSHSGRVPSVSPTNAPLSRPSIRGVRQPFSHRRVFGTTGSIASPGDRNGKPVRLEDIVIVAPYNAHVERIGRTLAEAGLATERVGTVDKFQGQEAPVVFYATASSSGEEIPRGLEFLFSRNRLNVAISRARCLAYLVCSPRLLEVHARTIPQMRLANALCRFVELAS